MGQQEWRTACLVSLLQMTPGLCVSADGLVLVVISLGSLDVSVGGLVKGDGISVLMGHIFCLLCQYVLPCALMRCDLGVFAGSLMVPSK